jgi:outer membrane receptor protein involved in Fe transport
VINGTGSVAVGHGLSIVASVRNLLNLQYSDPASDEHRMDAIEQNGRTLRVELRWAAGKQ